MKSLYNLSSQGEQCEAHNRVRVREPDLQVPEEPARVERTGRGTRRALGRRTAPGIIFKNHKKYPLFIFNKVFGTCLKFLNKIQYEKYKKF